MNSSNHLARVVAVTATGLCLALVYVVTVLYSRVNVAEARLAQDEAVLAPLRKLPFYGAFELMSGHPDRLKILEEAFSPAWRQQRLESDWQDRLSRINAKIQAAQSAAERELLEQMSNTVATSFAVEREVDPRQPQISPETAALAMHQHPIHRALIALRERYLTFQIQALANRLGVANQQLAEQLAEAVPAIYDEACRLTAFPGFAVASAATNAPPATQTAR